MEITKELWGKGLLLTIVVALSLSGCGKINIDTAPVVDLDEMCLHFTALENNSVILIVNHGGNKPDVKIKQNGLWKKWDYSQILLSKGQSIYMKDDNPNGFSTGRAKFSQIATTGKISSGGNVLSLLYENDFNKRTTVPEYGLYNVFNSSYGLVSAPDLPATTLVTGCYREMFNGCASLKFIKMGAIDISAKNCLLNWTEGVASEGTFIKNEKAEWSIRGYDGIPFNWTVSEASEFFSN